MELDIPIDDSESILYLFDHKNINPRLIFIFIWAIFRALWPGSSGQVADTEHQGSKPGVFFLSIDAGPFGHKESLASR